MTSIVGKKNFCFFTGDWQFSIFLNHSIVFKCLKLVKRHAQIKLVIILILPLPWKISFLHPDNVWTTYRKAIVRFNWSFNLILPLIVLYDHGLCHFILHSYGVLCLASWKSCESSFLQHHPCTYKALTLTTNSGFYTFKQVWCMKR